MKCLKQFVLGTLQAAHHHAFAVSCRERWVTQREGVQIHLHRETSAEHEQVAENWITVTQTLTLP